MTNAILVTEYKLRSHFATAILITMLFCFLFVVSEMIAELGLEVSRKCSFQRRFGYVIGIAVPEKFVSAVLFSSTASGIRQLSFEDGQLEFVFSRVTEYGR